MSETPRNDDEQLRDPTAPSYERPAEDPAVADQPRSEQPGAPVYGPPPGSVPPPPQNPYAAPPAAGSVPPPPQNPYAPTPYPTQGQVQAGHGAVPPGYAQAGGYGAPPPGYGGGYAAPRQMSGNTIALLVVSGLTTLGCGFGIVALVLAIIAATKSDQPSEQAKFTKWGWIAEIVGLALVVVVIVLVVVVGMAGVMSSNSSSTGY
jgi:hypothetical protein